MMIHIKVTAKTDLVYLCLVMWSAVNFPPKCSKENVKVTLNAFIPINNEVPGICTESAICKL